MNFLKKNVFLLVLIFWALLYTSQFIFSFLPQHLSQKLIVGIVGSMIAFSLSLVLIKFEGKKISDFWFSFNSGTIKKFGIGTILGVGLIGVIVALLLLLSPLELEFVESPNLIVVFGLSALTLFAMALMEEIIFRGYPLLKLNEKIGVRGAIYCTSIVFGLYHGLALESLIGPAVWGLIYGLMAFWSKGLALPTGLHFGLNWAQGFVGMKSDYVEPLMNFNIVEKDAYISGDTVGLSFQVILLLAAVILVEYYVRKKH